MSRLLAMFLVQVYRFIYKPEDIAQIFNNYNKYIEVLYGQGWFSNICSIMSIFGAGFLTVGFLISLGDKASAGDFTLNNFFRHFLKYFMLYVILMNVSTIFGYMMDMTSAVFNDMNRIITESITGSSGIYTTISEKKLATGLDLYFGVTSEVGMLISIIIPYLVSVVFYIILYFFATSRVIELVVRVIAAPLVVGVSFFGNGANSDIVRYLKNSMGIIFQIVVVLVIGAGVTFTHSALVYSGSTSNSLKTDSNQIENPALYLKSGTSTGKRTIEIRNLDIEMEIDENNEVKKINKVTETGRSDIDVENQTEKRDDVASTALNNTYTKSAIKKFTDSLIAPSNLFTGVAIMVSALFMLFKSREISMRLFS